MGHNKYLGACFSSKPSGTLARELSFVRNALCPIVAWLTPAWVHHRFAGLPSKSTSTHTFVGSRLQTKSE